MLVTRLSICSLRPDGLLEAYLESPHAYVRDNPRAT